MINKILIAEDHEMVNISLQKVLEELGATEVKYMYYCDDALTSIRHALNREQSFDLLITDLYFDEDGQKQLIKGGIELIAEARKLQPDLKVLVFSAEVKLSIIERLYNEFEIDAYVLKARNDARELKNALGEIAKNQRYFPRNLVQLRKQKNAFEFSSFDITILTLLSDGVRQKDIPAYLQKNQISPSGLSSVEKRLNFLKEQHDFSTNEQLIAFCKEFGII
ncbi:response regulator [Flavihumibacter sp. CACIAM 22H1]|uniref:response regulator n=1 Tax=Flavihumibacter sp. CACIAM 22H1 TaxID=1812911 RepID=UPI0007A8B123|nr:response regulator [Flavihumibacter sp. CACIAM 22H1]KYP15249.1 MAG: transcriptional regulator [Flavihumibacter sp. CACIAM 22H1]